MKLLPFAVLMILPLSAREPLAKRIAHTDPAQYRVSKGVHGGPGQLDYMGLLDDHSLDTNLFSFIEGLFSRRAESALTSTISARRCSSFSTAKHNLQLTAVHQC